jgi:hypothetical protein
MGRCRVVRPAVVRLALSDGDYLDVKRELTAGEYHHLLASVAPPQDIGRLPQLQPLNFGMARVIAFVVGWSFTGLDDHPLPYSLELPEADRLATLRSLDSDTFREIITALDAHEEQQDREKKSPRPASAVTS